MSNKTLRMRDLGYQLLLGDCLDRLRELPDSSVDSIVTDPPYGLSKQPDMMEVLRHWMAGDDYKHKGKGFMGKSWDSFVPGPSVWKECLRVLKPGGHLLCFAGARTQDMMGLAIRLAGFELRENLMWVFGSGFPKSHDISKAIDKAAGVKRNVVGTKITGKANAPRAGGRNYVDCAGGQMEVPVTAPATEAAKQWDGWGSALKPAYEPVIMARKPLDGTLAQNTLKHGCGGINVDGCRIGTRTENESGWSKTGSKASKNRSMSGANYDRAAKDEAGTGRFPANLIHDGSEEVVACFPETGKSGVAVRRNGNQSRGMFPVSIATGSANVGFGDSGSAARFFKACPDNDPEDIEARRIIYYAKASKRDRDEGCESLPSKESVYPGANSLDAEGNRLRADGSIIPPLRAKNFHPTVKGTALMRYLCRLVTPPNGIVLDPFMGSGSTGKAAMLEGFNFIGIEREPEYMQIAEARIEWAQKQKQEELPL